MTSATPSAIPAFVAVDWGTSSFRGWLMSAKGDVLAESRGGEGMLHCAGTGFAPVLRDHLARLGAPQATPVLICGMAGARQGWVEAPYLKTPTRLDALHEGAVRVDAGADIRILPGIAQARADRPDVMRGEETQLLGVLDPSFAGLVCIPGTHSKWIRIEAGEVVEFATYMTGELFSVISQHSILSHAIDDGWSARRKQPAVPRGRRNRDGRAIGVDGVAVSLACGATARLRTARRRNGPVVGSPDRHRDCGRDRSVWPTATFKAFEGRPSRPTL